MVIGDILKMMMKQDDPSTGLTRNGIYNIHQETKKKQSEEECKSSKLLTWNIYAKYLDNTYSENLRFNNELRNEWVSFISLTSEHLLADAYTSNQVSSTAYFCIKSYL